MSDRQQSCAERVASQLASRAEDIQRLLKTINTAHETNDDDLLEEAEDELYNLPLAVTEYRVWRIDLSTGGPADWIEVHVRDGEVGRIEFHFADWFDHASLVAEGAEYDVFQDFAERVTGDFYNES